VSYLKLLPIIALALAGLAICLWPAHRAMPQPTTTAALSCQAYLWQRVHTPSVSRAIAGQGREFDRLVILAGQIVWNGRDPQVIRVEPDWQSLAAVAGRGTQIGVALRIGELRGDMTGTPSDVVAGLARQVVAQVPPGITIGELQLDYDCPTRRLSEYANWVRRVRQAVGCRVSITALPTWLNSRDCAELAGAADDFVLQVHSVDKPHAQDPDATLCDPRKALAAIDLAAKLGRPFRVALPTYGYIAAFDARGQLAGLSAEGPQSTWPAEVRTRQINANPAEIAELVRTLQRQHPPCLQGIIYYRLPVDDDHLNWSFCTLRAVMHGQTPASRLSATLQVIEPGLSDVVIQNTGDADAARPVAATICLEAGQWLAADALDGFSVREVDSTHWVWQSDGTAVIRPGQTRRIGWIRTSPEARLTIK
jgi:hypothetical protein